MSFRPRVYFYCGPEEDNLQDDVIQLGEGLEELGVPFHANCDYWRKGPGEDYLFRHDAAVRPEDCDIVVVSTGYRFYWKLDGTRVERPLPEGLFRPGRRYRTVYSDKLDGHRTPSWGPEFRDFDLILRAKYNARFPYPSRQYRPWTLCLSRRMLRSAEGAPPFAARRHSILFNFGASHPYQHGSRARADAVLKPLLPRVLELDETRDNLSECPADPWGALMWRQTNKRHSPAFYQRLKSSQASACFCGELVPAWPQDPLWWTGHDRFRRHLRRLCLAPLARRWPGQERLQQWDSWRFWETLACGTAAVHVDLELYGVDMPVMPQNWVHYIGVDLARPQEAVDRLAADPGLLQRVAAAGRSWALEHYAPRPTAARFLRLLGWNG